MGVIKSLVVALAALPLSLATQTFQNSGTKSGFDYVLTENKGQVLEVSDITYKGSSALLMQQTFTPGYTGRYHSEVYHNKGYKRGDELFYGFMFRLSSAWEFEQQSYNIAQFIADRPGAGCDDDDWMPSSLIWIQGNQLNSRIVSGNYRYPDCKRPITGTGNLATVSAGVWHKVIIQAKWASDSSGYYKMWFDGNKVYEHYNIATTTNDDYQFAFRVGLYANGWHDNNHQMVGNQGFRQIWYDEVAVGTTFADVDPDQYE
ncbi:CAZyme family PL20 [Trichoderma aggressivum f. europaeum]|uniref:CAZyme family PL20 n=1 Tax=Trichoderma aggressivum f. europaeum TaxID=173218 RepID=A0AAE1J1V5_9HYPO|nr:CAZyme family PL20 [Trichoderma aggressivum f. europaeum]